MAPNTAFEQTTWSPALSSAIDVARIADMPGGRGDAGLGAFERGEAVLEHRHRRIGEARVDEALVAAGEARRGLRGVLEHEARGQEQRLGMLVELAARRAGAHAQGGDLVALLP